MRTVRALCSLAIVATAFGCGGSKSGEEAKAPTEPTQEPAPPTAVEGQTPPSAGAEPGMTEGTQPGQAAPPETGQAMPGQPPGAAQIQLSSNDLVMGSLSCMLGPVMHTSQMGSSGMQGESMGAGSSDMSSGSAPGPSSDRCTTTAKAANVSPAALYSGEPTAIETVRKAIDTRLSAEGASSDAANNTLAFYDKGVSAAKEARSAHDALALVGAAQQAMRTHGGSAGGPKAGSGGHAAGQGAMASQTADQIRAHTALSDLYQYGRNLGATEGGTQAQALAWVIGANRFMGVSEVPPQAKSLVAEPLFSALLNVPAPAPTAGRMAPAWNEYLAAAARSVSATSGRTGTTGQAVGGGPAAANEKANLEQVIRTTEERLSVLGQQLPFTSPLRSEVDRTTAGLNALEAAAATTPPSTQHKGSTQQKPKPTQNPKKQPTQ
jgi:hypothetical protein